VPDGRHQTCAPLDPLLSPQRVFVYGFSAELPTSVYTLQLLVLRGPALLQHQLLVFCRVSLPFADELPPSPTRRMYISLALSRLDSPSFSLLVGCQHGYAYHDAYPHESTSCLMPRRGRWDRCPGRCCAAAPAHAPAPTSSCAPPRSPLRAWAGARAPTIDRTCVNKALYMAGGRERLCV
jgi:hypothetical protein